MKCIKKLFTTRHSSCLHVFLFLLSCIFTSFVLSLSSSDRVSAAVSGSDSVQVYTAYQSGNTWGDESISSTPVSNTDQMVLYPTNMQKGAIFRFLFYPVLQAKSSVKGIIIKDIDVSFYIEDPYADSTVPDHNLCTEPHIQVGGITDWTGVASNCSYWSSFDSNDVQYIHYHFDAVISGNNSINITSSDLSPVYITLGTNRYNVANYVPIYERALLASSSPVYFNNITYGSIQYSTSSTDALLQQMISQQQATTGAVEDLEQTTISNTDRTVSAINTLNTSIQNQTSQQHDDYESEVQREEDKQDELEDQADDLTLSASSTGNPFANLFNSSGCVNMPTVGGWFNYSTLKVCSPYPSSISGILNFIGSAVIVGLLIKIYYKHMNGGYAS